MDSNTKSTNTRETLRDKTRGLYGKYRVERLDGSSSRGGKHHRCDYFVLDLTHDPHARVALLAYAESCEAEYPLLARDLRIKLNPPPRHEWGSDREDP